MTKGYRPVVPYRSNWWERWEKETGKKVPDELKTNRPAKRGIQFQNRDIRK